MRKIIGLVVVIVIILVLAFMLFNKKDNNGNSNQVQEKYYIDLENGYRQNISSKISGSKQIEDLNITTATIMYNEGTCRMRLFIENNTNEEKGDFIINIKILDVYGNIMTTLSGYIASVLPDSSTEINIDTAFDFTNAYDYVIEKK